VSDYLDAAERYRDDMTRFLREIIALPSPSGAEKDVAERIDNEMQRLDFDDAFIDPMGNAVGRMGRGDKKIVIDAHMDTVGVGDAGAWPHDPFAGKVEDGIVFGRGASDNKGAVAAALYGARLWADRGHDGADVSLYVVGTVMEEDCDGLGLEYVLTETIPDVSAVVLGECTNLDVYRGHRGRVELSVTTKGLSAHASAPERGENAVAAMAPIVMEVTALNDRLTSDDFLGKGTIAVTKIECETASLNAIPDKCRIYIDRRLTAGETVDSGLEELASFASIKNAEIEVLTHAEPSYTGVVHETDKYYPTWVLDENHPLVEAGVAAAQGALGTTPAIGKWTFSTNGVASAGKLGIPTIGFGPSEERWAHTVLDQCPVDHLTAAAAVYSALPRAVADKGVTG
jgi:putative selenium metabolism hydrolase